MTVDRHGRRLLGCMSQGAPTEPIPVAFTVELMFVANLEELAAPFNLHSYCLLEMLLGWLLACLSGSTSFVSDHLLTSGSLKAVTPGSSDVRSDSRARAFHMIGLLA